jgi:hypothetical protein
LPSKIVDQTYNVTLPAGTVETFHRAGTHKLTKIQGGKISLGGKELKNGREVSVDAPFELVSHGDDPSQVFGEVYVSVQEPVESEVPSPEKGEGVVPIHELQSRASVEASDVGSEGK